MSKKVKTFTLKDIEEALGKEYILRTPHSGLYTPWSKGIKIKPLEIHEGSIVIEGFELEEGYLPEFIGIPTEYEGFYNIANVVDYIITPEIAILYLDIDTRNWTPSGNEYLRVSLIATSSFKSSFGEIKFKRDPKYDSP